MSKYKIAIKPMARGFLVTDAEGKKLSYSTVKEITDELADHFKGLFDAKESPACEVLIEVKRR